jgi:cobalt-zinc-cadmium efflux system outer membrane protein
MVRVFCILLFCPLVASSVTLSLTDIASRVRAHHPALKVARLSIDEARGRQLGAGRLSNPTLDTSFQNESRVSPRTTVFGIDQSFPLTKRLSLEKQLTSQLVTAAEHEVHDVERRYIAVARSLAVKLLALDQQRTLRQQQTALAQKLADFAKDRAKVGELSPLDAAQAQVDGQRLLLEARRLEIEAVSLRGELKPMLGLKPQDTLALSGQLPSLALPPSQAWQKRADYQLSQTRIEATQTEAALAKAKRIPDVSAGFFASREQQDTTPVHTERTGFVGFRFSIPLPFWNRNQGEIAEKAASAERARLESEALAVQITGEADTARREMEANAGLVSDTRDKLLPLVIEQTSKLEKAYESGQTDLLTVLRAREQRLQLEAAALDAIRDFHLAKIRYESAIGQP